MLKESLVPGSPLSVTCTSKVHGSPLLVQVPPKVAVLPVITKESNITLCTLAPLAWFTYCRSPPIGPLVDRACTMKPKFAIPGPGTSTVPPPVTLPTVGGGGRRAGRAREVGAPGCTHRDAVPDLLGAPPEVRGIKRGGAGQFRLDNEGGVGATAVTRLEGPTSHREVCRTGPACHVRVAGAVDGDAEALVIADAAEIRGVNEPRPRRIHLRYEGIAKDAAAVETRVEGASDRREVTRT